jgi:ParB-like chromosome segregation protein Spo0J
MRDPSALFEVHPIASIFPRLDDAGIDALAMDIKANSQHDPIVLFEGKILDGVNRYEACRRAKIEAKTCEYGGPDPIGFVLGANLYRRHLDPSQRAMIGARLIDLELGANQTTKGSGTSIEVAAELVKVGRASIERARMVLRSGDPELIKEVEEGKTSVHKASQTTKTKSGRGTRTKPKSGDAQKLLDDLIEVLKKMALKQRAEMVENVVLALQDLGWIER